MASDSDGESFGSDIEVNSQAAQWGKAKYDYYYTDYVDKDYPSKLTAKEEKLAAIEQEEALRIQKKLLATLEDVDFCAVYDDERFEDSGDPRQEPISSRGQHASPEPLNQKEDLIDVIERQNRSIESNFKSNSLEVGRKRKRVAFENQEDSDDTSDEYNDEDEDHEVDDEERDTTNLEDGDRRKRRPINLAIQKNRGLTPYKKKEYRNPRVKHKLKYKKALSKRRRQVREAQTEYHRYSGEASGIKTSTIKSIKLC